MHIAHPEELFRSGEEKNSLIRPGLRMSAYQAFKIILKKITLRCLGQRAPDSAWFHMLQNHKSSGQAPRTINKVFKIYFLSYKIVPFIIYTLIGVLGFA
jgi:hypothetical protein